MAADILILDDSLDDCELMKWALQNAQPQVEVDVCMEPQEALAKLFDDSQQLPKVVILDVHLNNTRSGHDVLEELRTHERTSHLPVVVFTGRADIGIALRSYGLRANSHVLKPIEATELSETMGRIAYYWTRLNAFPGGESRGFQPTGPVGPQ